MVSIHVQPHLVEKNRGTGWGTKFSARKIWARQNCHIRLRGLNFGSQILLSKNFENCRIFHDFWPVNVYSFFAPILDKDAHGSELGSTFIRILLM